MSYTTPNTFVPGSAIEGAPLAENLETLREYISQGISVTDALDNTIESENILRNEPQHLLDRDTEFVSGQTLGTFHRDLIQERRYVTGEIAQDADLTNTFLFTDVADTCKTIVLENTAYVKISMLLHVHVTKNTLSSMTTSENVFGYLSIGGNRKESTRTFFFRENQGSAPAGSGALFDNIVNRRFFPVSYSTMLTPGTHTVSFTVYCPTEKMYVGASNIVIQVDEL